MSRPPLYPISWGWNANGRCGNLTDNEIHAPSHVQHSKGKLYVAAAAGKHHSVLVSETGNLFSTGENRKGQLGYGNMFQESNNKKPKKEKPKSMQCYPMQVTPSGTCTFGRDLRISQIGCGSYFSIGKEVSLEEGIDGVRGLRKLEDSLKQLKNVYKECEIIQKAWSEIRQERFVISKASQGCLVAWGEGMGN